MGSPDWVSDEVRREIARCHQQEREHQLAERLGVSRAVVRAEVSRIRASMAQPKPPVVEDRRALGVGVVVIALALVGLGLAIWRRPGTEAAERAAASTGTTERETPRPGATAADPTKSLYERLAANEPVPLDELRPMLEDQSEERRLAAVRALAKVPASDGARAVLPLLNDGSLRVRCAAIQTLRSQASRGPADPGVGVGHALLSVALARRPISEQLLALDALSKLPESAPTLVEAIERSPV